MKTRTNEEQVTKEKNCRNLWQQGKDSSHQRNEKISLFVFYKPSMTNFSSSYKSL